MVSGRLCKTGKGVSVVNLIEASSFAHGISMRHLQYAALRLFLLSDWTQRADFSGDAVAKSKSLNTFKSTTCGLTRTVSKASCVLCLGGSWHVPSESAAFDRPRDAGGLDVALSPADVKRTARIRRIRCQFAVKRHMSAPPQLLSTLSHATSRSEPHVAGFALLCIG